MSSVRLQNIEVRYRPDAEPALRLDELEVSNGEVLAVVGISGSGKTTLLKTVAGFIRREDTLSRRWSWIARLAQARNVVPMQGNVFFDGRNVSTLAPRFRHVALASQALNLYPHMTAQKNIGFPLEMRGVEAKEIKRRVVATAARLRIDKLLDRQPNQLSGGEQQRVALSKALVQEARVYLFDEPLSSIDAPQRADFIKDLRLALRDPRRTTFYVTHDLTEAFAIADRVAVLHDGNMLQVGSPEKLYKEPASLDVARMVWRGRMNVLKANFDDQVNTLILPDNGRLVVRDQKRANAAKVSVLAVAPTEAFRLLETEEVVSNVISGYVADVRFSGEHYLVDVSGNEFSLEVAFSGDDPPEPGALVKVQVDVERLRIFDGDAKFSVGSLVTNAANKVSPEILRQPSQP